MTENHIDPIGELAMDMNTPHGSHRQPQSLNHAGIEPAWERWDEEESRVRQEMKPRLKEHFTLARDAESIAWDMLSGDLTVQSKEVFQVQATLLTRVLHDLRSCSLLSLSGYTVQAWTVAASCFEAAHGIGFVANNEEHAKRWLSHTDLNKGAWNAYDALAHTIAFLDIETDKIERTKLIKFEYRLYEHLCAAKHVNPVVDRTRYIGLRDGSHHLVLTPRFSPSRLSEAQLGLLIAARSATTGLWVFALCHVKEPDPFIARIQSVMTRTGELLEDWNREAKERQEKRKTGADTGNEKDSS